MSIDSFSTAGFGTARNDMQTRCFHTAFKTFAWLTETPRKRGAFHLGHEAARQMLLLRSVNHRIHSVAEQIHAVQMAAYTQEAALLGVARFPPLELTVGDLIHAPVEFVGAFEGETLVGAICVCPDEEGLGANIASLVVHPAHQRRGIGIALLEAATERNGSSGMTVQTAAANHPALTLYARFGFKVYRRWSVGIEQLELVKLSREPAKSQSAASCQ